MTYKPNKTLLIPVLIAIGFMVTTPLTLNVSADFLPTEPVPDEAILPDISPGIPKHLNIQNDHQREYLRFTNVWGNIGDGNLEFEPIFPDPNADENATQDAYQNLFDADGNLAWHEVVSEFEFHDIHNHWHIAGIGEFSVREAIPVLDEDGNVVGHEIGDIVVLDEVDPQTGDNLATAVKVGFCIADVFKLDGSNSPTSQRVYWDCEVGLQGIQVGWADQYHQSVEDNEVPITDIPNGIYFLTHTWNPEEFFVDETIENDVSWMKFELTDDGNGNRKIIELEGFSPGCEETSLPGLCGEVKRNN